MSERSYPWGEPRDDDYDEEPTCKHCGYQMDWDPCHMIDCEDGEYDLGEEDCINYDRGTYVKCQECNGNGGHWYCPNKDCNPIKDCGHGQVVQNGCASCERKIGYELSEGSPSDNCDLSIPPSLSDTGKP